MPPTDIENVDDDDGADDGADVPVEASDPQAAGLLDELVKMPEHLKRAADELARKAREEYDRLKKKREQRKRRAQAWLVIVGLIVLVVAWRRQ